MKLFVNLSFLSIITSCSTTNIIPLQNQENNSKNIETSKFKVTEKKEFYLWGLFPSTHEIDAKKILVKKGITRFKDVFITHKNTISDGIFSILSFGLYYPQTYHLEGNRIYDKE